MTTAPMVLTTKQHRTCHQRWERFKRTHPSRISLCERLFNLAERSVLAFGPHVTDVAWLNSGSIRGDVYGTYDPVDTLLEALLFPADTALVPRSRYTSQVVGLIAEHEQHGSDGLYMPRSVVLGWICREHDLLLGDLAEAE